MKKIKRTIAVGTRLKIVRLSAVINRLDQSGRNRNIYFRIH